MSDEKVQSESLKDVVEDFTHHVEEGVDVIKEKASDGAEVALRPESIAIGLLLIVMAFVCWFAYSQTTSNLAKRSILCKIIISDTAQKRTLVELVDGRRIYVTDLWGRPGEAFMIRAALLRGVSKEEIKVLERKQGIDPQEAKRIVEFYNTLGNLGSMNIQPTKKEVKTQSVGKPEIAEDPSIEEQPETTEPKIPVPNP